MKNNANTSPAQGDSCNLHCKDKLSNRQIERGSGDKLQHPRPTLDSIMVAYSGPKPMEIDMGEEKGRELW